MLAFAANSLLCRMALGTGAIDPASFSTIRVIAGSLVLAAVMLARSRSIATRAPDWRMALALFIYMAFFSFAYRSLAAGTGALLLFGAVQITMFGAALRAGERFSAVAWLGVVLAIAGLVYLVAPGLSSPDPTGAILMAVAGIAWGIYSLRGRAAQDPIEATAGNFAYCIPLVLGVSLIYRNDISATRAGIALAVTSGAVASGLGYVVWYAALRGLTASRAAIVQLSVPVIAAFGGIVFLGEAISPRLLIASAAVLGGVAIVLTKRAQGR